VYSLIALPEHMANDPEFRSRRKMPNKRIFTGTAGIARIAALYCFKTQLDSFRKTFPVPQIPLWFYYSMQIFEYYYALH
jgi:hypothetical protein